MYEQPKNWRELERHPLSAEYEDLTGPEWDHFVEDMDEIGFDPKRPIVLFEDKILDGWQRHRACLECDIVPAYIPLQIGADAAAFVRIANDNRRHETEYAREKRLMARRGLVASKRAEGVSTRAIAKELGVSKTTVVKDIEFSDVFAPAEVSAPKTESASPPSGGQGCPPATKVTGTDGKVYEAKKPEQKKPRNGAPKFNEKAFNKIFGPLVRLVDQRGNAMGKGPRYERCMESLGEFLKHYQEWMKETA